MTIQPLADTNLFKPIQVGRYQLQHRVVLPPLTRYRNDTDQAPTELAVEYYGQRSSKVGTLLVTEATFISAAAGGYDLAPGIWSGKQVTQWNRVFNKVHENKSFIFVQLWHLGRASKPDGLKARGLPYVSSSANYITDEDKQLAKKVGNELRALTVDEIKQTVKDYAQAAANAIKAGADGVEIHGANGYLPDQFIQSTSNTRTDQYGGSVENRVRFVLEIVDAIVAEVGADRTGIRLSPWGLIAGMGGAAYNPEETFGYLLEQLEKRAQEGKRLAYIHLVEPRYGRESMHIGSGVVPGDNAFAFEKWTGVVIRAGAYHEDYNHIKGHVNQNDRSLIAFGRTFIANPDLPERLEKGWELNQYNRDDFYGVGAKGYTDYPFHK
ncbi:hypothetical protein BABINDRAFT_163602 [Babjeviella inositovora NRRL Y-12698]|uniref:Probable NADPH dehydrogenase n=1 Tax=Babjeviella inositovora NRRL Y-12698 TaxID=984486 RepID=A0A1E3QIS0_9ASCO|nr:uncharacterized protein BABINDRAFT_163602 [Babjeviella inositovora NRRL Y-12698]ODQ77344.1 hypothetical protein BABINDRAFT_163602 [Babjeviella inositovora NRRL Y-12698]